MYMSIQDAEQAMSNKRIKKLFKLLWEDDTADRYDFYGLASAINPKMTFFDFDAGWQYRTVLHERFDIAIQAFTQILFGAI